MKHPKPGEVWRDIQGAEVEILCLSLSVDGHGALVTYCQDGELWTRRLADFFDPINPYTQISHADGTAV